VSHRNRVQHRFGLPGPTGRCTAPVEAGRGVVRCGMLPEDLCHRFYRCRAGCAEEFASCEGRDRHEANTHGNGW
jgi:hypothetical protein